MLETPKHAHVPTVENNDELNLYLNMPAIEGDSDPLKWWHIKSAELPNMARMAWQFLASPASTTAGVERNFSVCGGGHAL